MFSSELITLADPDPSRKTPRKISLKMSVLRPSETVWCSRYEDFSDYTLFLTSSLWHHNQNICTYMRMIILLTKKSLQISAKIMQRLAQIGFRGATSGLLTAFGAWFGLDNAFDTAFHGKTSTMLEPKLLQNRAGSNPQSKNIYFQNVLSIRCPFLSDFLWNFDKFSCQNELKF